LVQTNDELAHQYTEWLWNTSFPEPTEDDKEVDEIFERNRGILPIVRREVLEKHLAMAWEDPIPEPINGPEDLQLIDTEALFTDEYWQNPGHWDAHDFIWKLKVDRLMEELSIPSDQQPAFRRAYDVSQGHSSLEWVVPSPPPEHTFEELPIIKENDEGEH